MFNLLLQFAREKVTEKICEQLKNGVESNKTFDNWHQTTCKDIIKVTYGEKEDNFILNQKNNQLTLGQAQKWLNMTLKYLWLLCKIEKDSIDKRITDFIEANIILFHVPLDSYILKYITKSKKKIEKTFYIPNNGLSEQYKDDYKKFVKEYKWSRIDIDKYEKYLVFQQKIRDDLNKQKDKHPLLWELQHWHNAIEFYNADSQDINFHRIVQKYGTIIE